MLPTDPLELILLVAREMDTRDLSLKVEPHYSGGYEVNLCIGGNTVVYLHELQQGPTEEESDALDREGRLFAPGPTIDAAARVVLRRIATAYRKWSVRRGDYEAALREAADRHAAPEGQG